MKKRFVGAVLLCSLIAAGANAGLLSGKKIDGEKEAKKLVDGDAIVVSPATTKPKPIKY